MRSRFRPLRALTVVIAGSLLLGVGLAAPAAAEDYPTWDEVEAAKRDERVAATQISQIEGLLVGLELKAAALAREAQLQGELYTVARGQADAAESRADKLDAQAQDAAARATESAARAGQLIAQAARTGGGDLSVALLLSPDADDLLSTLGTMGKLTEQAELIYRQAVTDRNGAQALTDQAREAGRERERLASAAKQALGQAQSAAETAQREVAEQQAAAEQLYAQLASLRGTTAEVERRYIAGLADQGGPSTPTNPANPTNPPTNGTPTNPPTTPTNPAPSPSPSPTTPPVTPPPVTPPPVPSAAAGAIAFARAQLGDPYVYGGAGPNGWDCSGLTKAAYASVGVYIGIHGASSQYNYLAGQGRLVGVGSLQPGDLVFYSTGGSTSGMKYHTAIYIGDGLMIEAPYEPYHVWITPLRYRDLVPYAARPPG